MPLEMGYSLAENISILIFLDKPIMQVPSADADDVVGQRWIHRVTIISIAIESDTNVHDI